MRPSFDFVVGIAALWVAALLAPVAAGARDESFTRLPSVFSGSNFADLGVVDADGDGVLDLFISSHTGRTVLLLGDGAGGFRDVSDAWGLAVDERVPYIESSADVPASPEGGLHLYFESERLVVRAHPSDDVFEGRIEFVRPVAFAAEGEMKASGAKGPNGPRPRSPFIDLETRGAGELKTTSWFPHHQILVKLAPEAPLDRVFLGRNAVPAYAREMKLSLVDRHGLAWADFDGDGDLDVFISVGGMVGMAPLDIRDELFVNEGQRLRDIIGTSGIVKDKGRARRVEWVDFDGDGRLDLYVGNVATPNQLWRQIEVGRFENVAPSLGLDLEGGDVFRWIDIDGDADPDLLVTVPGAASRLFVNRDGRFEERTLADCPTDLPNHIAVADFDADGDLDVFIADSFLNRIFNWQDGSCTARDATSFGMPGRSATANWVDFDNDGLLDIHLVPGGLRRRTPEGRYESAGLLLGNVPNFARCAWFDFDGDGDRDCVCTVARDGKATEHFHFRNDTDKHRGFAVDVIGPPLNRQAIGATMMASVGGVVRRHMVGESDGAHWSQGHYRIYVSLGAAEKADWLEVMWPDGARRRVESPAAGELIEIRWQDSAKRVK